LQFENARVLTSLFANDLKLLKQLEATLEVRVTTREGWLRVEGEPERIEQTRRVFEQLDRARRTASPFAARVSLRVAQRGWKRGNRARRT
jgi:phosphate starvation-inducible protein PhoH